MPETDAVFVPDLPVVTERLLIRLVEAGDLEAMLAYRSDDKVCRYIPPEPWTRETAAEALAAPERRRRELTGEGQFLWLAVVRRDSGELIGDLNLFWRSELHRSGEIGYVLRPDQTGRGYATEAAAALLAMAFDGMGLRRVIARIDARNGASAAVLRRLGMRQEAHLVENEWFKGEWGSEIDFAILEREWRERQTAGSAGSA